MSIPYAILGVVMGVFMFSGGFLFYAKLIIQRAEDDKVDPDFKEGGLSLLAVILIITATLVASILFP